MCALSLRLHLSIAGAGVSAAARPQPPKAGLTARPRPRSDAKAAEAGGDLRGWYYSGQLDHRTLWDQSQTKLGSDVARPSQQPPRSLFVPPCQHTS